MRPDVDFRTFIVKRVVQKQLVETPLNNTFTLIHGGDCEFSSCEGVARHEGLLYITFRIIYGAIQPSLIMPSRIPTGILNDFGIELFMDCLLYNIKGLTIDGPVWRRPMDSRFVALMGEFLECMALTWLYTWYQGIYADDLRIILPSGEGNHMPENISILYRACFAKNGYIWTFG